jgi:hypothetical protein
LRAISTVGSNGRGWLDVKYILHPDDIAELKATLPDAGPDVSCAGVEIVPDRMGVLARGQYMEAPRLPPLPLLEAPRSDFADDFHCSTLAMRMPKLPLFIGLDLAREGTASELCTGYAFCTLSRCYQRRRQARLDRESRPRLRKRRTELARRKAARKPEPAAQE